MKDKKVVKLVRKKNQITLKNSDLEMITNSEGLGRLRQSKDAHGNPVDLPVEFCFKLAMLLDKLQSPINAYVAQKQKLIDKYADRDKEGKLLQPIPGQFVFTSKATWFQKEFNDLLNIETPINCERLEILMKDIPKGVISTNDIIALMPIIIFKEK